MSNAEQLSNTPVRSSRKWVKPLILLAVVAGLIVAMRLLPIADWMKSFLNWVDSLGTLGPVVLGVAYVVACILFVPGSLLTLGAGALFGLVKGTITVSIASTLGATAAFLVGRYFARDAIAKKIEGNAKFEAVDRAVANEGWKIVGLTRLSPVFPFNLLNYAYGLTKVSLRDYFFASWVGMLPGTIMYVYIGSLGGDLATLGAAERSQSPAELALKVVGLLATIIVTVYVTKVARKALQEAISDTSSEVAEGEQS